MTGSISGSMSGCMRARFRRLQPEEDPEGEVNTYNVVVMEVGGHVR